MSHTNRRSKRFWPRVPGTIDDNLDVPELEKSIRKEVRGGVLPGEQQGRVVDGMAKRRRQACLCSSRSLQFVSLVEDRLMAEVLVDIL